MEAPSSAKAWGHWENFGFSIECHEEPTEGLSTEGSWSNLHYKSELSFLNKFIYFIYLFLAALDLLCCAQAFSSFGEQRPLFVAVSGVLTAVASLVAEHGL